MPRLARPLRRRRAQRGGPSPVQRAVTAIAAWPPFAAVNLSAIGENNPLKDFRLPPFELPFLFSIGGDPDAHPNRRRLVTVSEFFKYTEQQDKDFFAALDRDGDGRVGVADLKECLKKQNLPADYAYNFINRARGGRWWSTSITFDEFKSLIDDNESKMLRAFCVLDVDPNGGLDVNKIKASLKRLNLPENDSNAKAMLRAVGKAEDASVAYGEFRRFVILLPKEKLMSESEPNVTWFESATCLPIGGPIEEPRGTGQLLLKAALAGGLSSGTSTLLMHPLDTLKTRVQSIPGASIRSVVKDVPSIGTRAIYRGLIPAATGAFSSHGIRTCSYEACLIALQSLGLPYMSAQPMASFVGTFVGTLVRIPCEVLKQQLQVGRHANVKVAFSEIRRLDGSKGFFRGSAALLVREVPFYVFGMVLYEQYKRCFNGEYFGGGARQLNNTESIVLGALAGASASFLTTPADVLKSRLMTSAAGSSISASQILVDLIQKEGIGALYKGALPRAVWVAPLGAMNFAGYELAKRAMGATNDGGKSAAGKAAAGKAAAGKSAAAEAVDKPQGAGKVEGKAAAPADATQVEEAHALETDANSASALQPGEGPEVHDADEGGAVAGGEPSKPLARIQWPWLNTASSAPGQL